MMIGDLGRDWGEREESCTPLWWWIVTSLFPPSTGVDRLGFDNIIYESRFELYHPKRHPRRSSKSMGPSPFVKISADLPLGLIFFTMKPLSLPFLDETNCANQWYLIAMSFDLGVILGNSIFANIRAPALSCQQIVVCMDMTSLFLKLSAEASSFSNSRSRISTQHAVLVGIYIFCLHCRALNFALKFAAPDNERSSYTNNITCARFYTAGILFVFTVP